MTARHRWETAVRFGMTPKAAESGFLLAASMASGAVVDGWRMALVCDWAQVLELSAPVCGVCSLPWSADVSRAVCPAIAEECA